MSEVELAAGSLDVVIKHEAGNIRSKTGTDVILSQDGSPMVLTMRAGNWTDISDVNVGGDE